MLLYYFSSRDTAIFSIFRESGRISILIGFRQQPVFVGFSKQSALVGLLRIEQCLGTAERFRKYSISEKCHSNKLGKFWGESGKPGKFPVGFANTATRANLTRPAISQQVNKISEIDISVCSGTIYLRDTFRTRE